MWYGEYEICILSYRREKKNKTGNSGHNWKVNIKTNLKIFWDRVYLAHRNVHCGERLL